MIDMLSLIVFSGTLALMSLPLIAGLVGHFQDPYASKSVFC